MIIKIKYIISVCLAGLSALQTISMPVKGLEELVTKIASDQAYCTMLQLKEPGLLEEFYCNNKYQLQWYAKLNDELKRNRVIKILNNPDAFIIDQTKYAGTKKLNKKCLTEYDSLMAEIRLTDMLLYFYKEIAYSHASLISYNGWKYTPGCIDIAWLLQQGIDSNHFERSVGEAEPESKNYKYLKTVYRKLFNSGKENDPGKQERLKQIKSAVQWYRWISCMSNKAYVVINLATKKLSFMESGKELFNSRIETGEIPFNDYTLSALIQHVKLYYDGNYPSTLIFDFDNPFQLALSSIDPCIVNKNIHFIKIEKADELATALEIDKEEIIRSVCPEEATPYYEFNSRRVPVFIMNVQLDF